ncbi:MAG: SdrD B-like domain-containing protein, partial [Bacteroidota bacterium]
CMVDGGVISTADTTTICAGDGVADDITVALSGNMGDSSQWVVTDTALNILELPTGNVFNFDGAGFGSCLIWHLSYEGTVGGLVVGQNAANLSGCFDLSNSILVIREGCSMDTCMVDGGVIATTDTTTICAGDGVADDITVALSGNVGDSSQWVVTDTALNILELPNGNVFNFDGAGFGSCLIWHLSFEGNVTGLVVGQNAANLSGCFDLSNSILVIREDCSMDTCLATPSQISTSDATVFCVNDGQADSVRVALTVGMGDVARFVLTDTALTILGISTATIYDFEGTAPGICLLWNLTYQNGLTGLTVGEKVQDLQGCFALSNSLTIIRQDCRPDTCTNFLENLAIDNPSDTVCSGTSIAFSTNVTDTGFVYDWTASAGSFDNNASANPTYTMMMPGTYEIIVAVSKDGCTKRDTTNVTILATPTVTTTSTDVICAGENNGSITATVSGGQMPYTYAWSDAAIGDTAVATNLVANAYSLTVTDANGCVAGVVVDTVLEGSSVTVNLTTNNADCQGSDEGSITAVASGGTAPYSYAWGNGADSSVVENLTAGVYRLTVTDARGCSAIDSATVVEPAPFFINIIHTPLDICPGGAVSLGVAPSDTTLTYQWGTSGGNLSSTTIASPSYTMMMPGTYDVYVTADNGTCTATDTVEVTVRTGVSFTVQTTNVSCAGDSTGSIDLTVSDTTKTYVYIWSNGLDSVQDQSNLPAGVYSVTVADQTGCSARDTIIVGENPILTVSLNAGTIACNGDNTGSISATTSGGTAPITYVWSNGIGNVDTIQNLAAGTYSVTATDALGCAATDTVTIAEPTPFFINIINPREGDTLCPSSSVNLTASPNNSTLSYSWTASGGRFDDSTSATPVYTMRMPGSHEIILTVSNGTCSNSDTTIVIIGNGVVLNVTKTDITCNGDNDGTITVNVVSGKAPYTYAWSNGIGNIPNPTGLDPNDYSVTVTDADGCTATDTVTITQASGLNLSLTATDIDCNGDSTGAVQAIVVGGTTPLTLAWSTGDSNVATISTLIAGTYRLTLTDGNNCEVIDSIEVTEPTPLVTTAVGEDMNCSQMGSAYVTASGGTPLYAYLWSDATAQTTDTALNLVAGIYTVTTTDANGCSQTDTVTVQEVTDIACSITVLNDIETFNGTEGRLGVTVTGGTGNYTYRWNNGGMDSVINDLSTNNYIVTITDDGSCSCIDSLRLLNPAIIGDFVFEDIDSNGIQNAGELGIPDVTLQLTGTTYYGEPIVLTTMTDANGNYQFNVPPGDVKITVVDAFGYLFSPLDAGGDDSLDSDFDPNTNMSPVITLAANDSVPTVDLGLITNDVCDNILLGGEIRANEVLCGPSGDPAEIVNVTFPSGGTGPIEYLWLRSNKPDYFPGDPDWIEIPNSNSPNYDPGIISDTNYFIRCARRAGCNSYPGETNIIRKAIIDCLANPSAENLNARVVAGDIALDWEGQVASDEGKFIIEKSTDGVNFEVISVLESSASAKMEQHQFTDESPTFGENYYRIKTFAPRMESTFSNVAMAELKPANNQRVHIYPNPAQSTLTIQLFEKEAKASKAHIINSFGQTLKTIDLDLNRSTQDIDISNLPNGIYFLKFDNGRLKRFGQKIYKIEE